MEPLDSLNRWNDRLRDRARAGSFGRFVLKRFLGDRLFEAAGRAVLHHGVRAGAFVDGRVRSAVRVPGVRSLEPEPQGVHLLQLRAKRRECGVGLPHRFLGEHQVPDRPPGALALIVSLLVTLTSVEAVFNRIWRVPTRATQVRPLPGVLDRAHPGCAGRGHQPCVAHAVFALAIFETVPGRWLEGLMLRVMPMAIELLAFAAIFKVVPHRTVKWRHAFAGAALSVFLFECVKSGLALYLGSFNSYQTIYGTLAIVPILMLWIFLGWTSILFGASFASSMSAFRYQPLALRLPHGYELYGLLRMLGRFQQARSAGKGLHSDEIQQLEPILTDSLVQELLGQMAAIKVVSRAEDGQWLLARDLDDVSLGELYEAAHLRVPVAEARLPHHDDALGVAVMEVINGLRMPLRDLLKQRVSCVYERIPGE
jgi:membrane protein